ncbi:MAG: hypothetical protein A2Y33_05660 [Spirochaetes bacterium GWF1_51_8]|nr:MAG: hypothetical protein A2Y33_05660 [Spirochaetes bacterium GWF1_51_8]
MHNKKQHFLPKFYLKGFTSKHFFKGNESECFWVYDKVNKGITKGSPEKDFTASYYYSYIKPDGSYDHDLEKQLSKVEYNASKAIKNIIRIIHKKIKNESISEIISEEDLDAIIEFTVWQIKRVPSIVDLINSKIDEFKNNLVDEYSFLYGVDASNEMVNKVLHPDSINKKKLDLIKELGNDDMINFFSAIKRKNIRIFYISKNEFSFITSDNPVIRINNNEPNGLNIASTRIFFPLHKKLLILFYEHGKSIDFYKVANYQELLYINKSISLFCHQKLISRDKEMLETIREELYR